MPKSSKEQIDNDDKKIIAELQKNSKESIDKIAKKCGFSRQKVWRTIKRLETNNIIWGYCAIVDDDSFNCNYYIVLFKRTSAPFDNEMKNEISQNKLDFYFPETNVTIRDVYNVNGIYDWVVSFTAPGTREMKMFCEKILRKFGTYISDYKVLEVMTPIRILGIKNPLIDQQINLL